MTLTVTPLEATLGARVTGLGLETADEAVWGEVEDAFHAHALLVFPGLAPSTEQQVAFARRFGEIERLTPNPDVLAVPISNIDREGNLLPEENESVKVLRGNEGWHTDSSYMPLAAKASVLSARIVPDHGGETEWADMRAAYEELPDALRERIQELEAYHSLYHSQSKIGHQAEAGGISGFHTEGAPRRPLVKIHPVTERPALYIGRHAYGIPGLSEENSEALLDELLGFACQVPRTWRHTWTPGDLVIWDNRAVLHRACPYPRDQPRVMVHTRVAGDPRTEYAAPHADHR